jgi:hypothetical protein
MNDNVVRVPLGKNFRIRVHVVREDGQNEDLSLSDAVEFGMKRDVEDDGFVVEKHSPSTDPPHIGVDVTASDVLVDFIPEDTAALKPGRYIADVTLSWDDQAYVTQRFDVQLEHNVT